MIMRTRYSILAVLLGLLGLLLLAGCGGGQHTTTPEPTLELDGRVEDPLQDSAVGGTIFTMAMAPNGARAILDQAYQAEVTLTGVSDRDGGTYSDTTLCTARGSYQFANVPPGTYTVTATARSHDDPPVVLTSEIRGLRARGNIPCLMTNLILSDPANRAVVSGQVTMNGQPAAHAVVSFDISAYTPQLLQGNLTDKVSVIVSTHTDDAGYYEYTVPAGGLVYYIAAHSDASMVSEAPEITSLAAGEHRTINILLDPAESPTFGLLLLDIVSTTLPAPTARGSEQALITRLAAARALNAPREKIDHLERLRLSRRNPGVTRSTRGFIENDLYWTLMSNDVGVRGFHVYRSNTRDGRYLYLGMVEDPYLFFFFDNDPALTPVGDMAETPGDPAYYTVLSYAANGQKSPPATPIRAAPLPAIVPGGPVHGATLPRSTARITWEPVDGALSYMVMKFSAEPRFNQLPAAISVFPTGTTSASFMDVPPGEYWWCVSAFNVADPVYATAATFSSYRQVFITNDAVAP